MKIPAILKTRCELAWKPQKHLECTQAFAKQLLNPGKQCMMQVLQIGDFRIGMMHGHQVLLYEKQNTI